MRGYNHFLFLLFFTLVTECRGSPGKNRFYTFNNLCYPKLFNFIRVHIIILHTSPLRLLVALQRVVPIHQPLLGGCLLVHSALRATEWKNNKNSRFRNFLKFCQSR